MRENMNVSYADYVRWVGSLGRPVQPYSEREWDAMGAINKYGITLAVRNWLATVGE